MNPMVLKHPTNPMKQEEPGAPAPQGRTAVVTGATSGIGLATLKALVADGWTCLAVGRSRDRMDAADREVRREWPDARVRWVEADLSSISQVRALGDELQARLMDGWTAVGPQETEGTVEDKAWMPALFPACLAPLAPVSVPVRQAMATGGASADPLAPVSVPVRQATAAGGASAAPLDALVLCAGRVTDWYLATEDGYETQFAVNHLSQFLLARTLRPNLQAAGEARIVTISSGSHYNTRIRWDDIMLRRHYNPLTAYKQSKLCNVLFAAEWNRRHGAIATAFAIDPGLVRTEIGLKGTGGVVRAVWKWRMKSGVPAERPAGFVASLLDRPREPALRRLYWKDGRPRMESRIARDPEAAARLWRLTEQLCGEGS